MPGSGATQRPHHYQFGPFTLDSVRRVLFKDGQLVPLTPKAFDVLVALLEHRGEVLDKERLMQRVWPDQALEEGNLTVNMRTFRWRATRLLHLDRSIERSSRLE